jgi:hypothetical protein
MKKLAFVLCSALSLLAACGTPVTAPQPEFRISTEQAPDTTAVSRGGSGMGSGN